MKANALLKWLVPAVLIGVVFIVLKTWVAGGTLPSSDSPPAQNNLQLSAEQAKSLGIAGDTP
ncbi:TIGR03752 family integrating conjugative element protein, partial [Pseudomonas sp. MAFF 311096]|nr:TIGR03752 family integrating conjugative element protein [Pseudomonas petroselini]